jgi:hypothetical protein
MSDREVMQMALRKLEQLRLTVDSEWGSCRDLIEIDAAGEQWPEVIALRARLAEPEPEPEPVAWMVYTQDGQSAYVTDNPEVKKHWRALPLYTAPLTRLRADAERARKLWSTEATNG